MKKLLAIISSLTFATFPITTLVACGVDKLNNEILLMLKDEYKNKDLFEEVINNEYFISDYIDQDKGILLEDSPTNNATGVMPVNGWRLSTLEKIEYKNGDNFINHFFQIKDNKSSFAIFANGLTGNNFMQLEFYKIINDKPILHSIYKMNIEI